MSHYICRGSCNGKSDEPSKCQTKGCNMEDRDMENCDCEDGFHGLEMDSLEETTTEDNF